MSSNLLPSILNHLCFPATSKAKPDCLCLPGKGGLVLAGSRWLLINTGTIGVDALYIIWRNERGPIKRPRSTCSDFISVAVQTL